MEGLHPEGRWEMWRRIRLLAIAVVFLFGMGTSSFAATELQRAEQMLQDLLQQCREAAKNNEQSICTLQYINRRFLSIQALAWISTENDSPKREAGFPDRGTWSNAMIAHSTMAH